MIASEEKVLAYLKQMFSGYAFGKTGGNGMLDFLAAPPVDSDLPTFFVESKQKADRLRDSQKEWAESEVGVRYRKYVCYTPDAADAPCFLYPWEDWLLFVEQENCIARATRKELEDVHLGRINFRQELRDFLLMPEVQSASAAVIKIRPSTINTDKSLLNGPYESGGGAKHEQLGVYWVFLNLNAAEAQKMIERIKTLL